MHRQQTPHFGYESLLGLPLVVLGGILIHTIGPDSRDANIGIVVIVITSLFGMRMFVKTIEKLALSRYPRTIKQYISGSGGKPIDKLFWKWILIYYATTAAFCVVFVM